MKVKIQKATEVAGQTWWFDEVKGRCQFSPKPMAELNDWMRDNGVSLRFVQGNRMN